MNTTKPAPAQHDHQQVVKECIMKGAWDKVVNYLPNAHFAVPHVFMYETLKQAPLVMTEKGTTLRRQLFNSFAEHLVGNLTEKNVSDERSQRRLMALLQAGSFTGNVEYLIAKNMVLTVYKVLRAPIPLPLTERIKKCEGFRKASGQRLTESDYLAAGYVEKVGSAGQASFVHPDTGDAATVHFPRTGEKAAVVNGHEVKGVLSPEEQEKRRLANIERNAAAKAARKNRKKVATVKPDKEKKKEKKGQKDKGQKQK